MTEKRSVSTEIADLMLQSDKNLEKIYRNSLICTGLIGTGVLVLLLDLLFLSIANPLGLAIYYSSLFTLLFVLISFLYFYYEYTKRTLDVEEKLIVTRRKLLEEEQLEEFRDKIRVRITRMKNENSWFKQLLSPDAFSNMDQERDNDRGNEEFEYFVRKYFEKMGFRLERSAVVTDSGVYMLMAKGSEKFLVYPIHPAQQVGQDVLKEVNRELLSNNINSALIVTTGSFTDAAREYTKKRNFLLYDKAAVIDGIKGIIGVLESRIAEENELLTYDKPLEKISAISTDINEALIKPNEEN